MRQYITINNSRADWWIYHSNKGLLHRLKYDAVSKYILGITYTPFHSEGSSMAAMQDMSININHDWRSVMLLKEPSP